MLKIINKLSKKFLIFCMVMTFILVGIPSSSLLEYISNRIDEHNIVDTLYWSLKDTNVVDIGMVELLKPKVERANAATFSIQTGYYVGNDTDNRAITGVGFSPDLVLIKDNTAAGSDGVVFRTSVMSGDISSTLADPDANKANNIQSLDSDGFTIGNDTDVNSANIFHSWIAFSGSDCSSSGTFCVGSYTGNGSSQSITSVGFQPNMVIVKRSGATNAVWKSSSMSGTVTSYLVNTADIASGAINSLDATGFSIGNNTAVNTNANTYYYIAFKEVSGFMDVGTYTGNGADNRAINSSIDAGLNFEPDFVFTKTTTAVSALGATREGYGDRSFLFTDTASNANYIQQMLSGGGFEVGTASGVNGSGVVHNYAAFKGASIKSPGTGTFTMANGSYTGTGSAFSVTGLDFQPDLVIVKHNDQATDQYGVFRTSLMIGDRTAYLANSASVVTLAITALNSDGFTLGTHATVNTSGDTYYWTAFGNAMLPDKAGGTRASDFLVGQYLGSAKDNTNVDGLSIHPDFVAVKLVGTTAGNWRTSDQSGDLSLYYSATGQAANIIQSLNSDGFQKGTSAAVNTSASIYDYFAFKDGNHFTTGQYTGSGSAKNVTGVGFQPDFLWIKKTTGGTARAALLRTSAQTGNAAQPFLNLPTVAGAITNLIEDGFSVGTDTGSNENTFTYQYVAWDAKRYDQRVYRWFDNTDSTDVGTALSSSDTAATLSATGDAFRLRLLNRVDYGNLFSSGQSFKLQFAEKSGSCDTSFSGETYTDVTGATAIAYNDNATPSDASALSANASDPTDSGRTIVNQEYVELNDTTNSQGSITNGQTGKWDFSLIDNGAPADTAYCFRLVKSSGAILDTYTVIPEITTASAGGNSLPIASAVTIDSGASSVTLIENTTKTVSCTGTVTDLDGFSDITSVTADFYRTDAGTSNPLSNSYYYQKVGDANCIPSSGSGNSETYTCDFAVQYYADPTDAGSPYSASNWTCLMTPSDSVGAGTSDSDTIEMDSLVAIGVTSSINYGTVNPNTDSGATNQAITVTNTGNRSLDNQLSGSNMVSGGDTLNVGQQKYASSAFTYSSGGTILTTTPTTLILDLALPQSTTTPITDTVLWGIGVPNGHPTGTYTGTNTVGAIAD